MPEMSPLAKWLFPAGPGLVSLVGAGGKTTLMYALARDLVQSGRTVLTTATTHIHPPRKAESPCLVLEQIQSQAFPPNRPRLHDRLAQALARYRHVTVASCFSSESAKLAGLAPSVIAQLYTRLSAGGNCDCILVEADGAAGCPLKAPAGHEPVVPDPTTFVVGVVGLRAVGRPLARPWVFRSELFQQLTGLPAAAAVTTQAIASLVAHPQGLFKKCPPTARRVLVLNQADDEAGLTIGREVLRLLQKMNAFSASTAGRAPEAVFMGSAATGRMKRS